MPPDRRARLERSVPSLAGLPRWSEVRVIAASGHGGLPDLATANCLSDPTGTSAPPPKLTVAYDVLGGQFAIDGGGSAVASVRSATSAPIR